MPQRKVYIAIPTRTGEVKYETMRAVIKGMTEIANAGMVATLGESLECFAPISLARNLAVARFLATDYDDLFFVDDDVAWSDGAMVRLINAPVDLVAGAYPRRYPDISFPVNFHPGEIWWNDETHLIDIPGIAAGFMRITRAGLERMVEHYADSWYNQFKAPNGKAHMLFDFTMDGRDFHSEDYTFCDKWRAMGEKVWLDPSITFMHLGVAAFSGNIGQWLKDRSIKSAIVQQAAD